ncbi:MAG: ABC transporter ATP-binding protein [Phycisphaerae bacterium]|jgi:ATP-binding cassette subfamily B protein|nr:ABC transporter ATP-binding protein [Phycisphaerae bacterium]
MAKKNTFWRFMKGQRLRYAAAIGALFVSVLVLAERPVVFKVAIDHIISGKTVEGLWVRLLGGDLLMAALAVVGITVISGLFMYLKGRWAGMASEAVARDLRNGLYDHIQHLPCTYHDTADTGDLLQRCTSDVETFRAFLAVQGTEIGRASIAVLVVFPYMLLVNVPLALMAMAIAPVVLTFAIVFFVKVRNTFRLCDEAEAVMTTRLQENLTGIRVVRAFARQGYECEQFSDDNALFRDRRFRLIRIMAIYWSCSNFLCTCQIGLILLTGAYMIRGGSADTGGLTVGGLVAMMFYMRMFLWPIRHLGRVLGEAGKAVVAMGRLGEILAEPREAPNVSDIDAPDRLDGRIEISDLSFNHGDIKVLDRVSVSVDAGQTLAILGPSGSGKSTLVNLLLSFYDYDSPEQNGGSIRLDGLELSSLDQKFVRSQIGVVMQEPFLYSRSVRDNIRIGHSGAAEDEIVSAAASSCVHESIEDFDKGYDTLVGERGVTLSGGQRQRLALARAVLRNPPILILDDALSAVDTETEQMILEALRTRHGRSTTLVIAHRLSTLMHADRIIVVEGGRIVQEGTHQSLVGVDGMYRRLWQVQNQLAEDLRQELASDGDMPGTEGEDGS